MADLRSLRTANIVFKVASPLFLVFSFSFHMSDDGVVWIMWRNEPAFASLLTVFSLLCAIGWIVTARQLKKTVRHTPPGRSQMGKGYNILREMDAGVRRRPAFAVFLMFAIIGPLSVLMDSQFSPVPLVKMLLVTICSGGISASIILFGNKRGKLILFVFLFILGNAFSDSLTRMITGREILKPHRQGTITLSEMQQRDIKDQRLLIGAIAMT